MGHSSGNMDSVQAVLTGETLLGMQKQAEAVYTAPELIDYIVTLTEATRVHEYLLQGISPRGSIALLKMARAYAFYMDRDYLVPEDIHAVFLSVCSHRVILNTKSARSRTFCRRCPVAGVKNCPYPTAFPCPLI